MVRQYCLMKTDWLRCIGVCLLVWVSRADAASDPDVDRGLGLSVGPDGQLYRGSTVYRGVGVNYYDLFVRQLLDDTNRTAIGGLEALAQHRIPFVRFAAGGYWPRDWGLYQTNRSEYFARLDNVVQSAERLRIGLIPSLFWHYSAVPDLVREPVGAWGDTNSLTVRWMREYTRQVVLRYRGSRAIWAWEFGNEYNLPADLPNASEHRPPIVPDLGTPAQRSAADDFTHQMLRSALMQFGLEVRHHDRNRLIVSGNAFPRPSAWHQIAANTWQADTPAQFGEVLAADNPSPVNSLCVRAYEVVSDLGRLSLAMKVSREIRKPLFVGEFGVPGELDDTSRRLFSSMLQSLETNQVPLAALWVYDFGAQAKDWNVTFKNARSWQLEQIMLVNDRIASSVRRRQ